MASMDGSMVTVWCPVLALMKASASSSCLRLTFFSVLRRLRALFSSLPCFFAGFFVPERTVSIVDVASCQEGGHTVGLLRHNIFSFSEGVAWSRFC